MKNLSDEIAVIVVVFDWWIHDYI